VPKVIIAKVSACWRPDTDDRVGGRTNAAALALAGISAMWNEWITASTLEADGPAGS